MANPIKNAGGKVGAFEVKFRGPFKIRKILGNLTYELESLNSKFKDEIVHYNKLLPYYWRDNTHELNYQIEKEVISSKVISNGETTDSIEIEVGNYITRSRKKQVVIGK